MLLVISAFAAAQSARAAANTSFFIVVFPSFARPFSYALEIPAPHGATSTKNYLLAYFALRSYCTIILVGHARGRIIVKISGEGTFANRQTLDFIGFSAPTPRRRTASKRPCAPRHAPQKNFSHAHIHILQRRHPPLRAAINQSAEKCKVLRQPSPSSGQAVTRAKSSATNTSNPSGA